MAEAERMQIYAVSGGGGSGENADLSKAGRKEWGRMMTKIAFAAFAKKPKGITREMFHFMTVSTMHYC